MSGEGKNRLASLRKEHNKEQVIDTQFLEQTLFYERKIYDLEQLIDIAKSFCSTLDFKQLLENIVYICMAQMHVLGAEIFVRDFISDEKLLLETAKNTDRTEDTISVSGKSPIISKMCELKEPVTLDILKSEIKECEDLEILERLSPTLIVPLIFQEHLIGLLLLQERIAIEDDTSYNDYEKKVIMSIASLASVAINNATLLEMASTDMMTHLKLKYYFYSRLTSTMDMAVKNKQKIAIIMFDIDSFKLFNDAYGHECGDFVLTSVASLIKNGLRDTDIACRYGGEEFTVLLTKTGKKEAMNIAERIRATIENYDFIYENRHLHVTISGGVSVFDGEKNNIESPNIFVDHADKALYVSKNNGRNKVSFYTERKQTKKAKEK